MRFSFIPLCEGESFDAGSFEMISCEKNIYEFFGLSADVIKLPTVSVIGTGSIAYCVDTGELYIYERTTKKWYKQ
jgi:hypothetical protein